MPRKLAIVCGGKVLSFLDGQPFLFEARKNGQRMVVNKQNEFNNITIYVTSKKVLYSIILRIKYLGTIIEACDTI